MVKLKVMFNKLCTTRNFNNFKKNFQDTCTVYKAGCFDICSTIFLILSLRNYRGQAMTQSP